MSHQLFRTYLITFIFLAGIAFPLINDKMHLINDIESFENRSMAERPPFNVKKLDPFPALYDTFYTDHFTLRNRLIRYFNLFNIKAYRKSPFPDKLVVGKNNWLFTTGDEMDSYVGKNRLTDSELEEFRLELEYRKTYLEKRNCKFYFLIVPCKASIYDELIGYEYFRMNSQSWGEQLNQYLIRNSKIKVINAFSALRRQKSKGQLYYSLDNHWNELGAFCSANEVIEVMRQDFPQLSPLLLSHYKIKIGGHRRGNIQTMLGDLDVFSEDSLALIPQNGFLAKTVEKVGYPPVSGFVYPWEYEWVKEINGSKKPRLLIISDSFGEGVFPFLSENFSRTVKIFDAWQYKLNEDIVANEKPDAVLLMIDEPILRSFLKFTSRPQVYK